MTEVPLTTFLLTEQKRNCHIEILGSKCRHKVETTYVAPDIYTIIWFMEAA